MNANEVKVVNDIHELTVDLSDSAHWNKDIAPTTVATRKWGTWDIAALWIGMSVCIPTYTIASSLINGGMNWWQALITILLGNVIVLIPMILNAHAGTKYGIPFPVFCRASFGLLGSNIPAILRAIVACGWFGIQTWIGGWAIYKLLTIYFPSWDALPPSVMGINLPQFVCFMIFWTVNMWIIWLGMESIRFVEDWGAPLLLIVGFGLLIWAYQKAGGFGPILSQPSQFAAGGAKEGQFWTFFFPALTANVGFWATLSLNIPDFTRFCKSQKDQVTGQALGLPTTMLVYSFIGLAVTSAAFLIFQNDPAVFGEYRPPADSATAEIYNQNFRNQLWDPVFLLSQFKSVWLMILSQVGLFLATLTTNLAANVVSPANDLANLAPKKISFRMGGLITGVIGIFMMPWKLYNDPSGYIFTWLIGYSGLLGPIGGVLIADYFILRKTKLNLPDLYRNGEYTYWKGINPIAVLAFLAGVFPSLPGFLAQINLIQLSEGSIFAAIYPFSWFVGFAFSFLCYTIFSRRAK